MNKDLIILISLVWMCGMSYLIYEMYIDLGYLSDLISAYIKMIVEYTRH